MEMDFWTFVLVFLLGSFLLAFLELQIKSTPVTGPDFAQTYELPPGLDLLELRQGAWHRKDTGALATKAEVQRAGLVWREPGQSTTPPGTPPGSPKATASERRALLGGAGVTAVGDKKRD